jgi:hypothetical protein
MVEDFKAPNEDELAARAAEEAQRASVAEVGAAAVESTENSQTDSSAPQTGDENYVQDPEKAHAMAEAGDDFRTKAAENREAGKLEDEAYNKMGERYLAEEKPIPSALHFRRRQDREKSINNLVEQESAAWDKKLEAGDETMDQYMDDQLGPTQHSPFYPEHRAKHYDEAADIKEEAAGEVYDEQKSADFVHNEAKAEQMAHTEDRRGHYGYGPDGGKQHRAWNKRTIERDINKSGDDYEIETLANRDGKTPEQVKELLNSNRRAFLDYSHAIAENITQYGDKLSPNLVVLEAIYDLAQRYPDLMKDGYLGSDEMSVKIKHSKLAGGALDIEIYHRASDVREEKIEEKWTAPVASSIDSWRNYSVTSLTHKDPDFDSETTTKHRKMKEEDAQSLKRMLAEANFDPEPEEPEDPRDYEDDGDWVSTNEIAARARAHFGGNTEEAREAAALFPGDFM